MITVTHLGQSHTINEWSQITGLSAEIIRQRLDRGWSAARALTDAPRPRVKSLTLGDVRLTQRQWAARTGIPVATLRMRLHNEWSVADALTVPVRVYRRRAKPGVASNFVDVSATGAPSNAQEFSQLEISE